MRSLLLCFCILLAAGCGKPTYPHVTYPSENPAFDHPDVHIEIPEFDVHDGAPILQLEPVTLERTSAEIVIRGRIRLDSDVEKSCLVHATISGKSDESAWTALVSPQQAEGENLYSYDLSMLGPANPGRYTLKLHLVFSESGLNRDCAQGVLQVRAK